MKSLLPCTVAFILLCCSCSPEPPRGDALSIDNPTADDYFVIVDEDTLSLPAYTCIQDFKPVCTGVENITYESGHIPGVHHYRVLDADKKLLFDTSLLSHGRPLLINPTRSTYVEWTVWYGDSVNWANTDTMYFDSVQYIGQFKTYSSFAIENESHKGLECERAIDATMKVFIMDVPEGMPKQESARSEKFFRKADFITAYNGFSGASEKEHAAVQIHNILTGLYNNTVENWTHPFRDGEVEDLYAYIQSENYEKAVDLINVNSDFFAKHDPEAVRELNVNYKIYKDAPAVSVVLPFTKLTIMKYELDKNGKPYLDEESRYDASTGECTTEYFQMPVNN